MSPYLVGAIVFVALFLVGYLLGSLRWIKVKLRRENKGYTSKEMAQVADLRKSKFASENEDYSRVPDYFKE